MITEEARQARNAYARNWRKMHPDQAREIQSRYWERRAKKYALADKQNINNTFKGENNDKKTDTGR